MVIILGQGASFMEMGLPKIAYKDVVSLIQNGDLIFCSGNYALSKVIRRTTASPYSHVAFTALWGEHILVFEAVESDGIRVIPLYHYISNYENRGKPYNGRLFLGRLTTPISSSIMQRIVGEGIRLLNARYDFEDLIRIFFRITLKFPIAHKEDQTYICSEFVEQCFAEGFGQHPFFVDHAKSFVSPSTVANHPKVRLLYEIHT